MALRILTGLLVALVVFPASYCAWVWALHIVVPPEFGMPDYEEEVEFAMLASSAVFVVVPILISIRVCGFLNRRPLHASGPAG